MVYANKHIPFICWRHLYMRRPYLFGAVVGKFQPLTNAHKKVITDALIACDVVVVYILDKKERNSSFPFSSNVVKSMLEETFNSNVKNNTLLIRTIPITDDCTNSDISNFVKSDFSSNFICDIGLYVRGPESLKNNWFSNKEFTNTAELIIPKVDCATSAQCREYLLSGDESSFKQNTPQQIHKNYKWYSSLCKKC